MPRKDSHKASHFLRTFLMNILLYAQNGYWCEGNDAGASVILHTTQRSLWPSPKRGGM